VNSLPKTVTGQHRDCDLNPAPSAPESSTLTTRLCAFQCIQTKFDSLVVPLDGHKWVLQRDRATLRKTMGDDFQTASYTRDERNKTI